MDWSQSSSIATKTMHVKMNAICCFRLLYVNAYGTPKIHSGKQANSGDPEKQRDLRPHCLLQALLKDNQTTHTADDI